MNKLSDKELIAINGGGLSGTLISSIIKGISIVIDLGRSLGTAIRRIRSNSICPV